MVTSFILIGTIFGASQITVLPENEGFLHADLTHDPTADLDKAEKPKQGK